MSSAKPRPENAEVERRVKRRLQRLHQKRSPPSSVVPSFVTLSELHRGHDIDMSSYAQPTRPTLLQEKRSALAGRDGDETGVGYVVGRGSRVVSVWCFEPEREATPERIQQRRVSPSSLG